MFTNKELSKHKGFKAYALFEEGHLIGVKIIKGKSYLTRPMTHLEKYTIGADTFLKLILNDLKTSKNYNDAIQKLYKNYA